VVGSVPRGSDARGARYWPMMRRLSYLALLVAVAAFGAALYRYLTVDRSASSNDDGAPLAHVHGLGIDPSDGVLYAATHTGLYRLGEGGSAERIADRYQDTMAFTIAGPTLFLASGHPDPREGGPSRLGLIESADAGKTWRSVALRGTADFHALAVTEEGMYGFDSTSGQFMASIDGRSWENRSRLDVMAFAADPSDALHVVASTPAGLRESTDGGRTWQQLSGPTAVVLAWSEDDALWAADATGSAQRSFDRGRSWRSAGQLPGSPDALLADGGLLYAAVQQGDRAAVYVSEDEGRSWQRRFIDDDD
jgi:photosystem II stability/assembly factor-like uncharacterized protein